MSIPKDKLLVSLSLALDFRHGHAFEYRQRARERRWTQWESETELKRCTSKEIGMVHMRRLSPYTAFHPRDLWHDIASSTSWRHTISRTSPSGNIENKIRHHLRFRSLSGPNCITTAPFKRSKTRRWRWTSLKAREKRRPGRELGFCERCDLHSASFFLPVYALFGAISPDSMQRDHH